ncbi:hypothetical protein C8F04DRAFT_1183959 [Mycena alexandri]|uniref:Uncharacterized protein n=1 Tax=Mycena alexandri TaxID=1745969 RepID=A0AAD6WZY9_9AGAR|nr:hypothetical protein C8F04DRAFT_1183959 [Mycena alexandri]
MARTGRKELCVTPQCPTATTHTWPYCTYVGGGMAGKTVKEANEKFRADRGKKDSSPPKQKGQIKRNEAGEAYITIDGKQFGVVPLQSRPPPPVAVQPTASIATAVPSELLTDAFPEDDRRQRRHLPSLV